MEPTKAPWATATTSSAPSPIAKGETTFAPWAKKTDQQQPSSSTTTTLPTTSLHPSTNIPLPSILASSPRTTSIDTPIRAEPRMPTTIPNLSTHTFTAAEKRITAPTHLTQFLSSQSASDYFSFILFLNTAVKGRSTTDSCLESPAIQGLCSLLETLSEKVDAIPPAQQSLRYGNPSFRVWHAQLTQQSPSLLSNLLPPEMHVAIEELAPYLLDSFGNATRIDYGTGHETNFIAFLYCLARIGFLTSEEGAALVTRVFRTYLTLMRKIQRTYWLEPAGSHGAWGLDDYQIFPFLWGSAQLLDHPFLHPASILSREAVEGEGGGYLYFEAVQFVLQVKKGPLQETSPMLCDISTVPTWTKVNKGMIKMYQAEVLSKFPIMQHFLFGSLIPFQNSSN